MKILPRLLRGLPLATLLAASALALSAADPAAAPDRPVQLNTGLELVMPAKVKSLLLEHPTVKFLVSVDSEGKLLEYVALEATHHELLPRASEAVAKASFSPALKAGQPIQASAEVTVSFYDPEQRAYLSGVGVQPFGSSATDATSRRVYEMSKSHYVYRRAEPSELDAPITVRETKLMVLTDDRGLPATGRCVVDYLIDQNGDIKAPRVISSDNEKVALSALLTLKQTRFAPLTRSGGIPTYVKVRQPLNYSDSTAAAPAAPKSDVQRLL